MNDFVPERLHDALSDLAEEVQIVDVHERTLRTSRRLGTRRVVTVGLAVAALVALTAAGARAVIPAKHGPPRPPAASDTAMSSPTPTGSQTPDSSAGPSAAPPAVDSMIGTVQYLRYGPWSTGPGPLFTWAPGRPAPITVYTLPNLDVAQHNANVSPDGHWLTWVGLDETRPLNLVDLRTGRSRVLRSGVDPQCVEPAWAPDSSRLLIADGSGLGTLDVVTGSFTPLVEKISGCHVTWAPDGSALAFTANFGMIMISDPDGTHQRAIPHVGGTDLGALSHPPTSFSVESVSPGGIRVVTYLQEGPVSAGSQVRFLYSNAVLDTRTGQKVPLPVTGQLLQAMYRSDGSLLVRLQGDTHHQLVLISPTGAVLDHADEPAQLKDTWMLTT